MSKEHKLELIDIASHEIILSLYFVRHDPSGSGRKWLMRHDGGEIASQDNMTVEKFERVAQARAEIRDKEVLLESEAVGM